MFVRQIKRKCSVRGCKRTDCFAISRTREIGNTVIICKDCLEKALGALGEIDPKTKTNIQRADKAPVPSLFFNTKALTPGKDDEAETEAEQHEKELVPEDTDDADLETTAEEDVNKYKCHICGKTFDSEKGLKTHQRFCNPQAENE